MSDTKEPGPDRRRSRRTDVDLRARVFQSGHIEPDERRAVDVNEQGVFIGSLTSPPLHTALTIELFLGGQERLRLRGQVVRILRPERVASGEAAGYGVQFEADPGLARWADFCRAVAAKRLPISERRRFERVGARLQVHVRAASEAEMRAFVTQNLSPVGAQFETDVALASGVRVALEFHVPGTEEIVALAGAVVRSEPAPRGFSVAVRFDAPELEAFTRLLGR